MTPTIPEQFLTLKAAAQMTDAEVARFAIKTTAHYQHMDGEGRMTAPTPEQMHEAADRLFSIDCDDPAVSNAIYVLRTVADTRTAP